MEVIICREKAKIFVNVKTADGKAGILRVEVAKKQFMDMFMPKAILK